MVCFLVWLQFFVKLEILLDQTLTVIEGESDLLRAHAGLTALAQAIKVRQITIDRRQDVLSLAGERVKSTGQPDDLAMSEMLARAQMLSDDFENRFGAKLANALAADAREVSGNAIRNGVFQAFFAHWAVSFA